MPKQPTNPSTSAKPKRTFFDPWNSSSTGHQRADNRLAGSTSWRGSRNLKLGVQFADGLSGGARVADTVGAGSEDFGKDGRLENGGWEKGAKGLRGKGQLSLVESFAVKKTGVQDSDKGQEKQKKEITRVAITEEEDLLDIPSNQEAQRNQPQDQKKELPVQLQPQQPQIFSGVTVYINGSTFPTISDHKLKHLLVTHGGNLSISLGRRTVTHVILGRPNGSASAPGAGGGLAASKIQKEISSKVGKNVKFVTVEWAIESVRLGKRAPESRFEAVRLAHKGTGRVGDMFAKAAKKT